MCRIFKDGVSKACDEVCGKKRGRNNVDTWWWNEEVIEAISRRNEAHTAMCQNRIENNRRHRNMKNKARKAASKAMREKAEEALTELRNFPNGMLRLVKGLKTDSNELVGGRCIRGSDGKLCFSEKERGEVRKDYRKGP